jgi:hypothetical protein
MPDFPFPPEPDEQDERGLELAERLRRRAWRISNLVLHSDVPWIDIELEINQMRNLVEDEAPEKLGLFEGLYASRFYRLRDQWRHDRNIGRQ